METPALLGNREGSDLSDAPKLLAGGNPQIPKGYGEATVAAYPDAMPGWKQDTGRAIDALVMAAGPGVEKAVKWNAPFYGVERGRWLPRFRCFTRYVKVTFFDGVVLRPMPPEASKHPRVRYLDVHEESGLPQEQFSDRVRQAAALPGERM